MRHLGELEKLVDTTEYVGQKAYVLVPLHRSVTVDDEVTEQIRSAANEALERMMSEHGATPADLHLLWVKNIGDVEPKLIGELTEVAEAQDIDIWMYEATAA